MKITYFKLKNFANIRTAMNADEIEIDFTKSKNKIILITGPNGGGKTSMLSCLHPFAHNGNFDIRSDNSEVVIGENGYKEIHYQDGPNAYVIKHHYTKNGETHSVKSYIEKNGIELNPNGNQKSFKDVVYEELNIEPDYMKLVRLGNNVTNFIDHKALERKAFMGKILNEVDIYLKFHKKVSKDMAELKSVISHLVDKITKLGIDDPSDMKKAQKKLKAHIETLEDEMSHINGELSVVNHQISTYGNSLVLKEELDEAIHKQSKIHKVLAKKTNDIETAQACLDMIAALEKAIIAKESDIALIRGKRDNIIDNQDKLFSELDTIEKELKKITESQEIKDTEHAIKKLRERVEAMSKGKDLTIEELPYTSAEIGELIVTLDKCNDIMYTTYEFGKEPIKKAISFIVNNDSIAKYVESHTKSVQKNKIQTACEFVIHTLLGTTLPKSKCKHNGQCEVLDFYERVFDFATEAPDEIVEDETFVTYTKMAHQNISTVLQYIQEKKSLFSKLPREIQEMFILVNLFARMENLQIIFQRELIYAEMARISEYEHLQHVRTELNQYKEKLKLLKSAIGNTEYFSQRREEIRDEIDRNTEELNNLSKKLETHQTELISLKAKLEFMEELKESLEKKDTIDSEVANLQLSFETVRALNIQKIELEQRLNSIRFDHNKSQSEYNSMQYRLDYYKTYTEELSQYNSTYDEMELIRASLSSKEGIPLLFIQIYLKNIQEVTNELLDVIYGDDLYIDDFVITADEFKIPYCTKGTSIKDVCYASQGEKSFISLALSFALICQSIEQYNILLLDEIDATLDTKNREKFLQVLEHQISMIDGEQVFVISHNNMFNMYPVDIINTMNEKDSDARLANYIKIEKK